MNRWALSVLLVVVWLLLWGEPSVGNIAGGVAVTVALLLALRRPRVTHRHRLSPWHTLRLVTRFLLDLVTSSVQVILAVLAPSPHRRRAGVVAVPLTSDSPLIHKTVSDLLCLTPGTLTVDIHTQPTVLYVHVLGLSDADALRRDVQALERRAMAALPLITTTSDIAGGEPI